MSRHLAVRLVPGTLLVLATLALAGDGDADLGVANAGDGTVTVRTACW